MRGVWRGGRTLGLALLLALGGCIPARARPTARPTALTEHLSGMIWPLPLTHPGQVTSTYGVRGRRHHDGLDLSARTGDPIHAARDGLVTVSGWRRGYGNTVVLDHGGGVTTLYGHASALFVRVGDRVQRGHPIAAVGATGNATGSHLHFEVAWAGHPIDPTRLLPRFAPR